MKLYSELRNCCGCTACFSICPQKAISMGPDEKGFLYPRIDSKSCNNCGLCLRACPFHKGFHIDNNLGEPDVYAVKHRSDNIRMKSSSGGMFSAVTDYILDMGGIIYGAAYNRNFEVLHQRAETYGARDQFCGSKYVQSNLEKVFKQVQADLATNRDILFSGTPCQTAGLYSFLKTRRIDMDKLYLCDLVCHGTPSPKIFKDYLCSLEKKHHSKISSLTFRYKLLGWRAQAVAVFFENKTQYISIPLKDVYYQLFSSDIILRDSCYECPFTNLQRPSDITLADFWGIEKYLPEFEDEKGVSLALVNTEKGRRLYKAVENSLDYRISDTQKCMQRNLQQPSFVSPKLQQLFWKDYHNHGFEYVAKKYTNVGMKGQVKSFTINVLKKMGLYYTVRKLKNKIM